MKYNVLEDFELTGGKAEPVKVESGSVWIPAETGVKQYVVDEKVASGVVELIEPDAPTGDGDEAAPVKRKKTRR